MPGSAWGSDRLGAKLWSMVRKGSLRIREEKALEFNNFFFQIYQRKWEIYFLGLPRSARAYNPWEGVLWSMVRREGRLGLWAPKKFFKVPAPCVWNLSRNPRVCLGFRLPRGKALVHGGGRFEIPVPYVTTRGPDSLGGKALVHGGGLGLGPPKFFKVPARVCNLSRNARVCLGVPTA